MGSIYFAGMIWNKFCPWKKRLGANQYKFPLNDRLYSVAMEDLGSYLYNHQNTSWGKVLKEQCMSKRYSSRDLHDRYQGALKLFWWFVVPRHLCNTLLCLFNFRSICITKEILGKEKKGLIYRTEFRYLIKLYSVSHEAFTISCFYSFDAWKPCLLNTNSD